MRYVTAPWASVRGAAALAALLTAAACAAGPSPGPAPAGPIPSALDGVARRWVDDALASLSLRDQVAQLVMEWMPGAYVSPSAPDFEPLRRWVEEDHIGGVSPSIGLPHSYVAKLNALQERSKLPLLVGADFENGGPGMRMSGMYALPSLLFQGGGTAFPPTMAFGAIGDERYAYEYGRITAREARAVGVHLLFAPVLDVNSNPDNPVIATRSFGADPELVARLGAAFIRGARDGGALTTAKHFPGHGDTNVDSHLGLPVVEGDRARLDTLELLPFRRAIAEGVDAVMTAHVQMPGMLGPQSPPATLAPEIMTGLLRGELRFAGLLLTDALTMGAITDAYGIGEASVRALEAGADVLLSPKDVPAAIDAVIAAVESGRVSRARVEASARRLLEMKARLGLHLNRVTPLDAVDDVVGSGAHLAFADSVATRSITLARDEDRLVPLRAEAAGRVVHVRYAPSTWLWAGRAFAAGLGDRLAAVRTLNLDERSDARAYAAAAEAMAGADRVLVSAYVPPSAGAGPDAVPEPLRELVSRSVPARPTVLLSFGNPYLLAAFPTVGSYLVAWGDREVSQGAALKALFGEEAITGRLPIPLPPFHSFGEGLSRSQVAVFHPRVAVEDPLVAAGIKTREERAGGAAAGAPQTLADPASVGMDPRALARVDSIVRAAVADSAASAAVVAIGRHGRLVKLEAFGELAWGSGRSATPTSLFDLASVSKVVGTTTGAMILVQEGRLDLDAKVVQYLPWWSRGDPRKEAVTVRQLLLHRTGLPAFRRWFVDHAGPQAYKDAAADEPLEADPGAATLYSDIGIMTLAWIMEEVTGRSLDAFLHERVWSPLGMLDTRYRPDPSLKPRIAATELDTLWRKEMVWGRVHDENADAAGGVAGHAGLFSTAVDLSVFARMMLGGGATPACVPGEVPGEPCPVARPSEVRLLDGGVLASFTHRFDASSSRGLGWDTPSQGSSGGDYLSSAAFGHTGFTGTSIWMDPELDLWVVLLTNRVHPTRDNQKHVPLRRAVADAAALAITDQPVRRREPGS
ncbi:MAG: glycoside hydrolase family 3 N-terminal domain-containing protein [Longimicrobiales bacterium]|nr:glycoside hydrolase family 3 N-terminal domain-containing protein [Longimicrobiales bacterium]